MQPNLAITKTFMVSTISFSLFKSEMRLREVMWFSGDRLMSASELRLQPHHVGSPTFGSINI